VDQKDYEFLSDKTAAILAEFSCCALVTDGDGAVPARHALEGLEGGMILGLARHGGQGL
jgi:hypothetical protein